MQLHVTHILLYSIMMNFFGGLNFDLPVDCVFRGNETRLMAKRSMIAQQKWPYIWIDHICTEFFQFSSIYKFFGCDEIEIQVSYIPYIEFIYIFGRNECSFL